MTYWIDIKVLVITLPTLYMSVVIIVKSSPSLNEKNFLYSMSLIFLNIFSIKLIKILYSTFVDKWITIIENRNSRRLRKIIIIDICITLSRKFSPYWYCKNESRNLKNVSEKIFLSFPSKRGIINPILKPLNIELKIENNTIGNRYLFLSLRYLKTKVYDFSRYCKLKIYNPFMFVIYYFCIIFKIIIN